MWDLAISVALILVFVTALTLFGYFLYRNQLKFVFVADYQRALRFKHGKFTAVSGPGAYRINRSSDQLQIVDLRPQPVVIEQLQFEDLKGTKAILSLGTELIVSDPYLATVKLKDQVNDSIAHLRDTIRRVTAARCYREMFRDPQILADVLTTEINSDLRCTGMVVNGVEITEIWPGLKLHL